VAPRGNLPNLIAADFHEPEVPIRPGGNAPFTVRNFGGGAAGGGHRELGNAPLRRDLPDLISAALGEPEVPVGPGCDGNWAAADGCDPELGKNTLGRDPPMTVVAALGTENSVIFPAGVIRPILLPKATVNQMLPISAPSVMPLGSLSELGSGNSLSTPLGLIRPMASLPCSVNQRLPSRPTTIPLGALIGVGSEYSVNLPLCTGWRDMSEFWPPGGWRAVMNSCRKRATTSTVARAASPDR
jgi:hypothetical protein